MKTDSVTIRTVDGRKSVPKAVIFDFDGVILESATIKTEAFLALFADNPEHRDAILRYHLDNLGISRYKKFEWIYAELLGLDLTENARRELGEKFSALVLEKILNCAFVPGAIELLTELSPVMSLFVASGTPQAELDYIVGARNLNHYFREVWGTPRGKTEIIQSILFRFALDPNDAVFIGDGMSDYLAAKESGVRFLAREADHVEIDWDSLGAESIRDLRGAHRHLGLPVVQ